MINESTLILSSGDTRPRSLTRLALISGNIVLHIICHDVVNAWNATRPSAELYDFSTIVDQWIPYIPWTWIVYYVGDLYILFWGAVVVWKMPHREFTRAIPVYGAMIIIGALMHIVFPGRSPWPENGALVQRWFHEQITFDPYVCLPSMHVALTVLPTCMTFDVLSSRSVRIVSTILAALITVSTVTLKEHYALDAVAGTLLALICYTFWRMSVRRMNNGNLTGAPHDDRQTHSL